MTRDGGTKFNSVLQIITIICGYLKLQCTLFAFILLDICKLDRGLSKTGLVLCRY